MTDVLDFRVVASPAELRPLRHALASALAAGAISDSEQLDVVSLANELVTVAIVTGTRSLHVSVELDTAIVRVSVTDVSESGRVHDLPSAGLGFALIDRLADSWGISNHFRRMYVWAELPVGAAV